MKCIKDNVDRNTLIEPHFNDSSSSIYIKCNCGLEILEFNAYRDEELTYNMEKKDVVPEENVIYSLQYHGILNKKDIKYGYSDFYFVDKNQVRDFVNALSYILNENIKFSGNYKAQLFLDYKVPEKYIRKRGGSGLRVDYDGNFIYIQKYRNIRNLNKLKHLSWEVLLNTNVADAFVRELEKMLSPTAGNRHKAGDSFVD